MKRIPTYRTVTEAGFDLLTQVKDSTYEQKIQLWSSDILRCTQKGNKLHLSMRTLKA